MTERHDRHHAQIAERVAAYLAAPKRSGLDKHLRREKFKRAVGTLQGHLGSEHGFRHVVGPPLSLEELHARHVRCHEEEA